jgi:hypothetical protein
MNDYHLKEMKKSGSIINNTSDFPFFGVSENCNVNTVRSSCSNTGLDRETVLPGSLHFAVNEIEVFEVAD